MTDKHTSGPWTFYTEPQPNGCQIVGSRGIMVAMLAHSVNYPDQKEEALANARLIAAAPELLEALITAEQAFVDSGIPLACHASLRQIRDAIAQATGVLCDPS